jgi:membrane-associated protease RseP (regulator of RpoE activity)
LKAVALLGTWALAASTAMADGGPSGGFQGFGLGYRLGYGYGGAGMGVLPNGGFPFYSGPGYPHPWPRLRRIGGITPFPFFGGPGFPTPECPNYFGPEAPRVADPPVIVIEPEPGESDFGCFTGGHPNAEALFAPFTVTAATGGSASGVSTVPPSPPSTSTPPPMGDSTALPPAGHTLGIDAEPFVGAGQVRGLRVTKVYPGTAAEQGGLQPGDVLQSMNGYLTEKPGNVTWILSNAASDNVLRMNVRTVSNGEVRTITTRLR